MYDLRGYPQHFLCVKKEELLIKKFETVYSCFVFWCIFVVPGQICPESYHRKPFALQMTTPCFTLLRTKIHSAETRKETPFFSINIVPLLLALYHHISLASYFCSLILCLNHPAVNLKKMLMPHKNHFYWRKYVLGSLLLFTQKS